VKQYFTAQYELHFFESTEIGLVLITKKEEFGSQVKRLFEILLLIDFQAKAILFTVHCLLFITNYFCRAKTVIHITLDTLIFNILAMRARSIISSEARNPLNSHTAGSRVFSLRSKMTTDGFFTFCPTLCG